MNSDSKSAISSVKVAVLVRRCCVLLCIALALVLTSWTWYSGHLVVSDDPTWLVKEPANNQMDAQVTQEKKQKEELSPWRATGRVFRDDAHDYTAIELLQIDVDGNGLKPVEEKVPWLVQWSRQATGDQGWQMPRRWGAKKGRIGPHISVKSAVADGVVLVSLLPGDIEVGQRGNLRMRARFGKGSTIVPYGDSFTMTIAEKPRKGK